MSVYGYTRLNISRKTPKGLSIKQQEEMIRNWVQSRKMELKKTFSDKEPTGASLNLPRLEKLIALIEKGKVTVLVIARLDRLTRSIRLFDSLLDLLMKKKVHFVSLTEGIDTEKKSGRLALEAVRILGRWEARAIPDRTREMIERKRKIGERVGHAPYGYIYLDGRLVPSEKELKNAEVIRSRREEDRLSYHRIAKYLNDRRIPSKRGRRWYAETVKTICESPLYGTPLSRK